MWWRETREYKRVGVWLSANDVLKVSLFLSFPLSLFPSFFFCFVSYTGIGGVFFGFGYGFPFIWRILFTNLFVFGVSYHLCWRIKCWVSFLGGPSKDLNSGPVLHVDDPGLKCLCSQVYF